MAIEISYEKVHVDGEKKVKITKLKGIGKGLPTQYMNDQPRAVFGAHKVSLIPSLRVCRHVIWSEVEVGDHLSEGALERFILHLKESGDRLKKINDRIREEKKTWHGSSTVII